MNKPNILGITRQQLSEAISNFQTPSCDPLNVSPWIAMSLLRKAIRRGQQQFALRAVATLLHVSPERLWRRCGCIAFEDIGVADLDTVAIVTAALAGTTLLRLKSYLAKNASIVLFTAGLNFSTTILMRLAWRKWVEIMNGPTQDCYLMLKSLLDAGDRNGARPLVGSKSEK